MIRIQHCLFILITVFTSACSLKPARPEVNIAQLTAEASLNDQAKQIEIRQKMIGQQTAMPAETQEANKARAARIAKKAHDLFNAGSFKKANAYLFKSIELDASVDQYYYEYGLTLYKMNLFAKALSILNMLEGTNVNQNELNYYQALAHYKIKHDDVALMKFKHVEESKDEILSPLAAMYAGLIEKSYERFDEAKSHFNYVLEYSKDPAMDKRAEDYIDDILRQQQFIERSKQKWSYSAYVGSAYDDNVLNAASVNAASNLAAYRFLYGGAVSYKAIYNRKHSLIPQLWMTDMYSFNDQFSSDSAVQAADPFQTELSLPYKYFGRKGTLTVTPSYQTLVMSLTQGNRNLVYGSMAVATTYTVAYADDWLTTYRLDLAKDTFHVKDIDPQDDQSSTRVTLLFSQSNILDDEGYKSLTMDLLYSQNNTEGDNFRYSKFLLGFGGNFPLSKSRKLLGYLRGDYFTMGFSDNPEDRSDTALILSLGAGYTLSDQSTLSFNLQYYDNSSSDSDFDFSKYVFTTIYTFNSGFF